VTSVNCNENGKGRAHVTVHTL